jgi:hypothetical protein
LHGGVYAATVSRRKLYRADLAALAGIKVDSLNHINLPERDGTDTEAGKARPYWYEATARAWLQSRPGKGWRGQERAS